MKLIYHGHSCVEIHFQNQKRLIIDPFITGNPLSKIQAKDIQVDYILITHGHNDHVGDAALIAKNNHAMIVSNYEIANYFEKQGFVTHAMNPGGGYNFDFGMVKMTPAIHSSTYTQEDGTVHPMGIAGGFLIKSEDKIIYHAGDTALFSDLRLISEEGRINVAFLPIGDNFTMGVKDACKAAWFLQCKKMVPIHYNTFDVIRQDPALLLKMLPREMVLVLQPGQELVIN